MLTIGRVSRLSSRVRNVVTKRNLGGTPGKSPYPDQAYPFGRAPGAPLEGWELITGASILRMFGILAMCDSEKGTLTEWARAEAIEREKVRRRRRDRIW